ncbi:MAG: hypothetical protein JWM25_1834, partial [Thermoleophilia bacterium]|nr:hypothetical protein [Thermoleophilia bacterium]
DLARLREDLPSLALFALLESRCNLLR